MDTQWFDDWQITHNIEGIDIWAVELPNTKGREKKIVIDFEKLDAKQMYQVEWLISHLDLALTELSARKAQE